MRVASIFDAGRFSYVTPRGVTGRPECEHKEHSMSSLSGISGSGMAQFLRGADRTGTGRAQGFQPPQGMQPPKEMQAQFQSKFDAAAKELGIDTSQFADISGKINDALKNVDLSQSSDPKATIESTVNDTLKANGVDADQFKSQFDAVLDKMGMPKPGEGGGPPQGMNMMQMGGRPGMGSAGGSGYAQSSKQQMMQTLLDSLGSGNTDSGSSRIAGFFSNAQPGSFLDVAA
jgi:hypothetical protein